jgi:hypothetical protein
MNINTSKHKIRVRIMENEINFVIGEYLYNVFSVGIVKISRNK